MNTHAEVILVSPESTSSPLTLDKLCKRFRTARLRALKEYPYAFGSTYEKESQFEDEVWAKRLQRPDAKTLVAICPDASTQTSGSADLDSTSDTDKLVENEWVGMIVLTGPMALATDGSESMTPWKPLMDPARAISPAASALVDQELAYFATSMFVLPEWRGQGLAGKIIKASVDTAVREGASFKAKKVNIGLVVEMPNKVAMKCYDRCGFGFLPDDPSMKIFFGRDTVIGMNRIIELSSQSQS